MSPGNLSSCVTLNEKSMVWACWCFRWDRGRNRTWLSRNLRVSPVGMSLCDFPHLIEFSKWPRFSLHDQWISPKLCTALEHNENLLLRAIVYSTLQQMGRRPHYLTFKLITDVIPSSKFRTVAHDPEWARATSVSFLRLRAQASSSFLLSVPSPIRGGVQ